MLRCLRLCSIDPPIFCCLVYALTHHYLVHITNFNFQLAPSSSPQVPLPPPRTSYFLAAEPSTTMSAVKEQETTGATNASSMLPPQTVSEPAMAAPPSAGASRRPSAVPSAPNPTTTAVTGAARPKSKKKKSQSGEGAAGENTGRWTAEEHRLFLQGLEQHGKGWKKIASLIKSRTVVQIRTHAQKYFQKLAKARQNGEEGDVTMEGRGDTVASASSINPGGATTKRRQRLMTGTKRKAIQSVVSSVQRQGKKLAAAAGDDGVFNLLPAAAPALAHFLLQGEGNMVDGIPPPGCVSSASLEDAL